MNRQEIQSKDIAKLVEESEKKVLALTGRFLMTLISPLYLPIRILVELIKVRGERDQYLSEKQAETEKPGTLYYEEV